jgi:hypothetical protein
VDGPTLTPAILDYLAHRAQSSPSSQQIRDWSGYILLKPRSTNSRRLVFLVVDSQGVPALVVKLSRIPGDDAGIEQEARNLRLLGLALGDGEARVPRLLLLDRWSGRRLLVEEALDGEPLSPSEPFEHAVADGLRWLQVATAPSGVRRMVGTRYAGLVAEPLGLASRVLATAGEDAGRLYSIAHRTLSVLRGVPLPLVFEHGDLEYRNVIRLRRGGIGVVDWEFGRPDGVPLSDLIFFLSFAAEASARPQLSPMAVVEGLMAPGSWGRDTLEDFARGLNVPPRLVPPLIVLSWTRQLATLSLRLVPGLMDPSVAVPRDVADAVARHRYRWVWESALRAAAIEQ